MLLDCGLLCDGLGLDFLLQPKGRDFIHVLESQCLSSLREQIATAANVSEEMESANIMTTNAAAL